MPDFSEGSKHVITFYVIPPHWHAIDSWNLSSYKSFEYTCLCRCDGFVVACSTVGCLCDNPRGAGGYEIVTMTTLRRLSFGRGIRSWLHRELSCWQFPLRSAAEIASKWRFYLFFLITSELFDEFANWFLNYQPPSIIVLRYHLVFYFTLFYFHIFHFKYCSYEYYS